MKSLIAMLLILIVTCADAEPVKYKKGTVIHRHGTSGGDAPYTVELGDKSYGCYSTEYSVSCQEQTPWEITVLVVNGTEYRLTSINPNPSVSEVINGAENKCSPIEDKIREAEKWHTRVFGTVEIDFRIGKKLDRILVPCVFLDKHNHEKQSEASYFVY